MCVFFVFSVKFPSSLSTTYLNTLSILVRAFYSIEGSHSLLVKIPGKLSGLKRCAQHKLGIVMVCITGGVIVEWMTEDKVQIFR